MIQPTNGTEGRYCLNLAALLVRSASQSIAGDEPGSKKLMASYRHIKDIGEKGYKERNRGLVEYADILAREQPRSDRLLRFMAAQDKKLAEAKAPDVEIEDVGIATPRGAIDILDDVVADDDALSIEPEPVDVPEPPKPKRTRRKPAAKKED